jgi:2-hydroxychromene-2-carboxylate isomerase
VDVELIAFTGPPDDAPFADPTANKYKLAYYHEDVLRMTSAMSLRLALPKPFDVDFRAANRACIAADMAGHGLAMALALSEARWGEGKDISDPAIVAEAAVAAGWTGYDADAVGADPLITERLREDRRKITEDGVFGVPFLVDGPHKYWGQDRFDLWLAERGR